MTKIALMGAGGKMGQRLTRNLKDHPDYNTLYVEISQEGIASLAEQGLTVTPQDEAVAQADVVLLALPDVLIGKICNEIVPKLKSGTMVISLDPAAGFAGMLPEREDISYFIAHPCHPPMFSDEADPAVKNDWFGGTAQQAVVCALHQGPEEDYAKGEAIARIIYAPVTRAHRVTTEQMVVLEPALVETLATTCATILREGMEEAIHMGVPEAAVKDFFWGHLRTCIGIVFDLAGFPMSDGAKLAVEKAKKEIFQPDWKKVMTMESIKQSVRDITQAT